LPFGNFYIPLNADAKHGWTIPIPRDDEKQFATRLEALAFARKLAQEESSIKRENNYLCVEGGDRRWRLFTADLMPVAE